MTATTFDTFKCMDFLKGSGIDAVQAEAITKTAMEAFTQSLQSQSVQFQERNLATKEDLQITKAELWAEIHSVKGELRSEIKASQVHLQEYILKVIGIGVTVIGLIQTLFHFIK